MREVEDSGEHFLSALGWLADDTRGREATAERLAESFNRKVDAPPNSTRDSSLKIPHISKTVDITIGCLASIHGSGRNAKRFGIFAPAAKQRAEVVPARGGRVAHNKRKGKRKAGANVAAAPEHSGSKPPGDGGEPFKLVGAAAVAYGEIEIEKEYSTKLTWAQCLRRAFFLDAMACPCGGRRQVIALILQASAVEEILRHVKPWRESGDKDDSDDSEIIAIRGPPGDLPDLTTCF